jgi:hypothetical protein
MTRPESLKSLQEAFARAIALDDEARLLDRLAGDPAIARRGVAVYREAVRENAAAALASAYPVVARLVGDAFFGEAARRHLEAEPSASGDLNRYGDTFPAFLAGYPHAAALRWLPDIARLEWAWHEALMAADACRLDIGGLARVPQEARPCLRFDLHPSVRLVRSPWPVLAIWEANQPDRDGTPARDSGPDAVLVWREAGRVRLARLAEPEALFLERLLAGATLEAAADVPGEWDLAACLRRFAAHGILCGFGV